MITVKHILEHYDIVTDKANSKELYLADLASFGIIEESKIPMIRRSLNKNINEMTNAEKKSLVSLLESLIANVVVENSGKAMSYPSDKDMPTVIILKRKAIRVFPDNQKIGLYYSQALDRYISIPFGPNVKDLSPQLNEETLDEVSQELASRAYAARMTKIKDVEDDSKLDDAAKQRYIEAHQRALGRLKTRMKTPIDGVRSWAGKDAVKAAKKIGNKQIAQKQQNAQELRKLKSEEPGLYMAAAAGQATRNAVLSLIGKGPKKPNILPSSAAMKIPEPEPKATKSAPASAPAPPASDKSRVVGGSGIPPKVNRPKPTKESFRNNLNMIREQRQLDEVSWEDVKSGAKTAADFVAPGVTSVAKKVAKGEVPSLSDVGSAALDVGTGVAGVATGGLGAAGIKGAIAGVRALRAGKSVGQAAKFAKQSASRSTGWKIAKGIGGAVTGAVTGAVKGAASLGDAFKDATKPSETQYNFGGLKPQVASPSRAGLSGGDITQINQTVRSGGYPNQARQTPFNESNLSILKQIVENDIPSHQLQIGEETISINKSIAKKLVNLHESLNKQNKKKLERMLNEDIVSFRKAINFVLKQ
jgi:hypothetical protein